MGCSEMIGGNSPEVPPTSTGNFSNTSAAYDRVEPAVS